MWSLRCQKRGPGRDQDACKIFFDFMWKMNFPSYAMHRVSCFIAAEGWTAFKTRLPLRPLVGGPGSPAGRVGADSNHLRAGFRWVTRRRKDRSRNWTKEI